MVEHVDDSGSQSESLVDKITEKIHEQDSSSSSDSDNEKPSSPSAVKSAIYRLFGRQKPVHKVFGGGKCTDMFSIKILGFYSSAADVLLWRNKKISSGILGGATAVWVLFELIEYHLVTLVCHCLILSLAILFLWSSATTFINKSPPHIPDVHLPEDPVLQIASALRSEINCSLSVLRNIALGCDLKKFLAVY